MDIVALTNRQQSADTHFEEVVELISVGAENIRNIELAVVDHFDR